MERVAPKQLNYDDVLPLAIESRSNRRTFAPINGSTFSNQTGSTIIRIDVNADSMLDAAHSYLSVDFTAKTTNLCAEIGPAWIQRLRIESGGVTIEDINEYGRLYSAMMLNQCPEDYVNNVCSSQGLYRRHETASYRSASAADAELAITPGCGQGVVLAAQAAGAVAAQAAFAQNAQGAVTGAELDATANAAGNRAVVAQLAHAGAAQAAITVTAQAAQSGGHYQDSEISYITGPQAVNRGKLNTGLATAAGAGNRVTATSAAEWGKKTGLAADQSVRMNIPLMSGFLNMDKYLPLIMLNAGFTIEIHLAPDSAVGVPLTSSNAADDSIPDAQPTSIYQISNVNYVAHLIDLDREFYGKLRSVMEGSGGVLQLAGQTYRHYSGILGSGASSNTLTLPARVKSVKSIFGTFISSDQKNNYKTYNTSVFQTGGINKWRFEIGSVRYPQTDISFNADTNYAEVQSELHKAFGKLGDYSHSCCVKPKHLRNASEPRVPNAADAPLHHSLLSGFMLGYDFEAFQKVALESGINTADRSLPINFVCEKDATTQGAVGNVAGGNDIGAPAATTITADFYVLSDAIYYINLDGTVSVSV